MHTATVVHTKQRTATLRDQCVHASSMLNSTPPMGAPKAACARQSGHSSCYPRLPWLANSARRLQSSNANKLHPT